ncbi:hypothetical protein EG68_11439 [Paragonimus skrjabini miyazakii]|uniref:Uncharacterized protein n=1 Tax=Paragonimus skrjabini miyazakii TaxID=59628 RepID=A0A8S9YDQ1_9TREM|nr:hypothetical protein EG68_11439 [Paragonimus skrjabini miyazakii]
MGYRHNILKYHITVNISNLQGLLPSELMWKINTEVNGENIQCGTTAEYLVPRRRFDNPDIHETLHNNELSITGPITAEFCEQITGYATHDTEACHLQRVGSQFYDGRQVGEYRILYTETQKYEKGFARRQLQSILNYVNGKRPGCSYNAYWVK